MKIVNPLDLIEKSVQAYNRKAAGEDDVPLVEEEDTVGRKALITDPQLAQSSSQGTYRLKYAHLPNRMLKEASQRDPIIQTILAHRRTQLELFCVRPKTRFDTGFGFCRKDRKKIGPEDKENLDYLYNYMLSCGDTNLVPYDDRERMADFFGKCVQDALTFGHVAIEKVRDDFGGMQRFRHVPAETVYHINKLMPKGNIDKIVNDAALGPANLVRSGTIEPDSGTPLYIQVVDNKEMAVFSRDTMIFQTFKPPSFIDNNGYSISLVEACILTITKHLQAENYNSLFFTHGFATRGILHLKGQVSQANLHAFRNQFNANIGGNSNSWRTPIVSGLDDIKWVPLAASQRDMEYIQYTDHLIRVLCSQAAMDPTEIGFDYLSRGTQQSSINTPNNEWKLTASVERGLKPLIRFFEDLVNLEILNEVVLSDKSKASDVYEFRFIGEEAETAQSEWTRQQAQMSLHASINDMLKEVEKEELDELLGGRLPLNQAWWGMITSLLTVGELREKLLGDKGASGRKELQYIPNSPGFLSWQQFIQQAEQAELAQGQMPPVAKNQTA